MSDKLPFVTALCPTFRHPELLANSLQLWLMQAYPLDRRELVILDDDWTYYSQGGKGWKLESRQMRFPSLPAKYNHLLQLASKKTDIFLVWEDDDIYLPHYTEGHVEALEDAEFSKPSAVLSDYKKKLEQESALGRFHASMAFRKSLITRIGGWPNTKRADFDQQFLKRLTEHAQGIKDPYKITGRVDYIYGWHTGAAHCQSTMQSQSDDTWYERGEEAYEKVDFVGILKPKLDQRTVKYLDELRVPTA